MNKGLFLALSILVMLIVSVSLGLYWKSNPMVKITPSPTITQSASPSTSPTQLPKESDMVRVKSPQQNQTVTSPLQITGQARGTWYFEASFPIRLEDTAGKTIASTTASAQGDWMTANFVPFKAQLSIPPSFRGPAILVLSKDNPSGLPQNAGSIQIPITVSAK